MPEDGIITDLPQRIVGILDIEPEWTVQEDGMLGFVPGEIGVLLAVEEDADDGPAVLRVEARLARHAPDGPETWKFCDLLNNLSLFGSLGGRWVHDPATGVVALVADLAVPAEAELVEPYAEFVALLTCRAEIAAFNSIPQKDLGAGKALTLLHGRRRTVAHPLLDRLSEARRAGADPAPVRAVAELARQRLAERLATWSAPRWFSAPVDWFELWSGYGTVLGIDEVENPELGWGIMIGASFLPEAKRQALIAEGTLPDIPGFATDPHTLTTLNRDAATLGGTAPGCWTVGSRDNTVHRLFLPAALLATATPQTAALLVEQLAWQTADQFHAGFRYRAEGVRVLAAPEWLGDEEADVIARREPYNDGPRPRNPHAVCHFEDALGRVCGINADSLALWESRLTDDDRATPGVLDFPRITSGYIVGGASHRRRT
ncbi:hypothetical protein [Sphaerimonospora thailandensis]|uniref:Uncharacterized protein n=1 Tax=Sphaerimonospora thailandensis TaxID=795644 RepID=A0A8J3W087_9ACTN|nr:hypothetical protein [Sphaerimonospora thailandensis]GIH72004.1 hypothetical protein Mth01_42570 [Sphaerimonospora thailandensis]